MSNKREIIAGIAFVFFPAFLPFCCSDSKSSPKGKTQDILQVKLFLSFPIVTPDNKFITVADSQFITYYKDIVLYKFPYTKEFSSNLFDSTGQLIEQNLIKTELKYQYLIYRKGEGSGFFFDSIQAEKRQKVNIDSFLRDRLYIVDKRLSNSNDSLIATVKEPNNIVHEIYIRKLKEDLLDCDTNHLFFSEKFRGIDFTFSKRIDSIKGKKLFKVRQISNPDPSSRELFFRNSREIILELKETVAEDKKEIMIFINRFVRNQ